MPNYEVTFFYPARGIRRENLLKPQKKHIRNLAEYHDSYPSCDLGWASLFNVTIGCSAFLCLRDIPVVCLGNLEGSPGEPEKD